MTNFVRFQIDDSQRFGALQQVFESIKAVKNLDWEPESSEIDSKDADYDLERLREFMPNDVRSNFIWPDNDEMKEHRIDPSKPVAIGKPGAFLGTDWSLTRILDLIDCCEYSLDRCVLVSPEVAELHVETWSYPYGGLNAVVALVEGFGFQILGMNECGRYESREEIEGDVQE